MKRILVYGKRDAFQNYAEALEGCGASPFFSEETKDQTDFDGLLLPGGGDVDPALYDQPVDGSGNIDPGRDRAEMSLIKSFLEMKRPIFGICRGLQILNVALGGNLIQDLETASTHKWEESTGDKAHLITVPENSFLFPLYGGEFSVNSAHHQGAGKVAPDFTVAASANDGVVEALQCPEKRIYAVQFHPERMSFSHLRPDTVDGKALFQFFLSLL